jgi:hypothetical protein
VGLNLNEVVFGFRQNETHYTNIMDISHATHNNMWNPMWTKKHGAIELHTSDIKLLTSLIPTPSHPATNMNEVCMNFEERDVRLLRKYMPICIIFTNSRILKLDMSIMHIMRIYREASML